MNQQIKRILLMGNPNVGKSVVFSRLTGVHVTISNYPGTTVEYLKGHMLLNGEKIEVIDVPGTYSLSPTCKAEEVATEMIQDGDLIVNVVDATNLERNLFLTLQLIELGHPMVIALNMWDETAHRGITIDPKKLSERLAVPVTPTTAVIGEGISQLVETIAHARSQTVHKRSDNEKWETIGEIAAHAQELEHHHHTFLQRIEDVAIRPISGIIFALFVFFVAFFIIRFIGEGLIGYLFDPLFENLYAPLLSKLSVWLGPGSFVHDVLIGNLVNGQVDFMQSFGVLTTGIYVPLAAVFPYIFSFYLILGIMEDVGYLPRVAVLLDNVMHRMGLHGYAIIPNLLGLGCNVPGILATRVLESKRERFIAATIISIAIPCASLQAMIIGLLGERGFGFVLFVYATLFIVWIVTGLILNKLVKGFSPALFLEVPPLRWPSPRMFLKKFWMRIISFLKEAFPIVICGVLLVSVLYALGVFDWISMVAAPVVRGIWGLPPDAVSAIAIGFLRKDVAVGMLGPLGLTNAQLVTGCTVLAMFFPCIASFTILMKELGLKYFLASIAIMLIAATTVGGLVNLVGQFLF